MISKTKIFGGKRYRVFELWSTKSEAQKRANLIRKKGGRARTVMSSETGGYYIYVYGKLPEI